MKTKVIVAYHEGAMKFVPEFFIQNSDIFIPILGGSYYYKQGRDKFYDKLNKDNVGENISPLTIFINEHSPLYWAWKHYKEIGDPDMIGLCHYRRWLIMDYHKLDPRKIYINRVKSSHMAQGEVLVENDIVYNTYKHLCGRELVDLSVDYFCNEFPEFKTDIDLVLNESYYYAKNLFVMGRDNFQEFMPYVMRVFRFLFSTEFYNIMDDIYPDGHIRKLEFNMSRGRGFIVELLVAVYFEHQNRLHHNLVNVPMAEVAQ